MANDPHIGQLFDHRYQIQRKLGSGGMADVYLAEDTELGRLVALKLLNDRHASDAQFVERFRREAQNAAGLNHPNIVQIFDRGQAEDTYYIAMEYLKGRSLKELLVRNGPTPIPIAIEYARQILSALSFAHRHGVVHRDIKPHNIVVDPDGRLKVTDFGIARSGASQMTEVGSIVGTAQYLSPEQAKGTPVDRRSDIYSLGIVLYEMLTGTVPFTGERPIEIAMKHLSDTPKPPSLLRKEVPPDLDKVVMRALSKDPDDRYDSAEEMDADLELVARGKPLPARTDEAMTAVIGGAAAATAATMIVQSTPAAPPPVDPAPQLVDPFFGPGAPKRRGRRYGPILGFILALAIFAIGGYLIYGLLHQSADTVAVPDVSLETKANATTQLQAAGFTVTPKTSASDTVPAGQVITQNPNHGKQVPKHSDVTIYVSTGPEQVLVPDVRNESVNDAIADLGKYGLVASQYPVPSRDVDPGLVVSQAPAPDSKVIHGSSVRINVSKGPNQQMIPDVTNDPYDTAKTALGNAGFKVVRNDVDSDSVPKGEVVSSDPLAGTLANAGTTVTLNVSKGPSTQQIPDVTGQTEATALSLLRESGYNGQVTSRIPVTDPSQAGIVLSMSPPQHTLAPTGTVVSLTVGLYTTPANTTTTTTTTPTTPPAP